MRDLISWLRRLPRAVIDLLWLVLILGTLWVALGRPAAPEPLADGLRLIARTDPDRVRIWLDGQSWRCSPSQPSTPGDDGSIRPLGRHSAIQATEPGERVQEVVDDER